MLNNDRFLISRTSDISLSYDQENEALDFSIKNFEVMLMNNLEKDKYNLTKLFKNTQNSISEKKSLLVISLQIICNISELNSLSEKLTIMKDKIEVLFNKKTLFYFNSHVEDPLEKKLIDYKKMIELDIDFQVKLIKEHKSKM